MTQKNWETYIQHAEQLQEDDFIREIERDKLLKPLIINLQGSDDEANKELQSV